MVRLQSSRADEQRGADEMQGRTHKVVRLQSSMRVKSNGADEMQSRTHEVVKLRDSMDAYMLPLSLGACGDRAKAVAHVQLKSSISNIHVLR